MGFLFALWRRLFGGYDTRYNSLENRGLQCIICITSVFLWEWLAKSYSWYISLIIGVLVYIFWCRGHFYYFQCGTESDIYIDECEKRGRKPAMNWLVAPINKWLGFEARSKQYCFIGMMVRYLLWSLPVSCFVGWHFSACAYAIPFIYNACFWVEFPKTKLASIPTNWAEIFSGLIIGWALI